MVQYYGLTQWCSLCSSTLVSRHLLYLLKTHKKSLFVFNPFRGSWSNFRGKPCKKNNNHSQQIIQQLMQYTATRGEEYKCVACLLLTLLPLIPIMSGAGPCSDCVAGMTAGLVLIRNDHRPGYKHTRTYTPVTHFRTLTPTDTCTSSSSGPAILTTT